MDRRPRITIHDPLPNEEDMRADVNGTTSNGRNGSGQNQNGSAPPSNGRNGSGQNQNGSAPPSNGRNGSGQNQNGSAPPSNNNDLRGRNDILEDELQSGSNPFDEVFHADEENRGSPVLGSSRPFTYPEGTERPSVRHDAAYRRYVNNRDPEAVSDLLLRPGFRQYGLESNLIGSREYRQEPGRSRFASSHAPASSSSSFVGFTGSRGSESFYTNPNSTPECGLVMRYLRELHQTGASEQVQNPMAGYLDEVVEVVLRQRGATFCFRSGEFIQVSVADFFGTMQRNVAAATLTVYLYNDRNFFQAERIWRYFMRDVQDLAVTGIAFASDVAKIVRVSERVSTFFVHNLVLDEADGRFSIIVEAFSNALHAMVVDARGFNGGSLVDALQSPVACQ
uniref:Uncharacterized protein n=1 Tax=Panagrolaimus davidi TaxID=227884 RepID=A0A914PN77_9BILA